MKILVTGGTGLVGTHLRRYLPDAHYVSSKNYDLTCENNVIQMYNDIAPTHVIHLAARVGGIFDNIKHQAEYYEQNILMNTLVLKYAYHYNIDRFIGILSSCIFPDESDTYPLKEEYLHLGPPAKTNFTYGIAKRCLAVQIEAYNQEYGTKYIYISPCNLYGEFDDDDENKSHFVTALIKKIYEANKSDKDSIVLYGDGTPLRQFMHAEDLAKVLKIVIEKNITESFNLCPNENLAIDEIARIALKATNSEKINIQYDSSKPNGQLRKDIDNSKFKSLIPNYEFITLADGIKRCYESITKNE